VANGEDFRDTLQWISFSPLGKVAGTPITYTPLASVGLLITVTTDLFPLASPTQVRLAFAPVR